MLGSEQATNFYYLNRDGHWPDFEHRGLDIRPDGAWQLASVPLLLDDLPEEVATSPAPDGPAGLAADTEGTIYFSRPDEHTVSRIDGCDGASKALPCLGGQGSRPTHFCYPRGLLFHPVRQALFVADSGNHRLQIFDPATFQLLGVWGQPELTEEPAPDSTPGRFDQPWSLAADAAGNVYVVDYGNARVQKFDLRGQVESDFWQRAQVGTNWDQPVAVASAGEGDKTRVYVVDAVQHRVVVLAGDGYYLADFGEAQLDAPLALAVTDDAVYVGDNGRRRVLKFERDAAFTYVGPAHGYEGPVAALAVDAVGHLWVHPGGNAAIVRLAIGQAYVKSGVFWGGPFGAGVRPVTWHRLKAIGPALADDSHAQLFVYTNDDVTGAPGEPNVQAAQPFAFGGWEALPPDVLDDLVTALPARYIWVGGHLTGEGQQSPLIQQMRVDYDHITYRQYLPAIFGKDPVQRVLLDQLLSLFESFYGDVEDTIAHLSRYFDPAAVPVDWLPWLAGWLALDLDENWSEAQQREAIAGAMTLYARRGTAAGLRAALRLFAGVDAHVAEPLVHAGWWALPSDEAVTDVEAQNSLLGVTTMLVPAEADGAVLGGTATLDQSHLITQAEAGAPLFENTAHQFSVQVYRGQLRETGKLATVRAVIEAEKPAHTAYHLCVIEPRLRIGFQARAGIDTIVGGPKPAAELGEDCGGVDELVLADGRAGRLGEENRIGVSSRMA